MKTKLIKYFRSLIVLFLLIFGSVSISGAALDSKGTNFWLMFPGNLSGSDYYQALFITSDFNTSGTVSIPGIAFSTPFNVTAGTVTTINFPQLVDVQTNDAVTNMGIHVTSVDEVTVYGLNRRSATTDAFLGLPVDILGTDYIVLGYENVNVVNATQFGIVAVSNGTTVSITPTETTGPHPAGVAYNVSLNEGETYLLRNGNSMPADLSGSLITSNLPVAVFGGHQCANIPAGYYACDHVVEQIPPSTAWGKNFLTHPLATRLNGDTWRILASEDNTNVSINAIPEPVINKGQFIEKIISAQSIITSDKPVLVSQYSNSSTFDGVTSDPFMMLIPPYEQFLAGYTVSTPAAGFIQNFVNIVAPNSVVGALTLDGVPVPVVAFTPIGASGFSGASMPIALGTHNLASTLPFGCFIYGFDSYDSYGYPGGQALSQIAIVSTLYITPRTSVNRINTPHCVNGLVKDQNNNPLPGIRVDYERIGVNPGVGFAFTDVNGIAQYCYTGTNIGQDMIIGTTGSLKDTVYKTWENPLPVEFSLFTSTVSGNDVTLNFATTEEINNSGFDIERKTLSSSEYAKIGFVPGNGSTNEPVSYIYTDKNLNSGKYNYRLKQIDINGNFEYFELSNSVEIAVPDKFTLSQNYPNPFNPSTKIEYTLPDDGKVLLTIYDNNGKAVATLVNEVKNAGYYTVEFNASALSSGVYFYSINYKGLNKVMKMTVLK
ncbi:MAG: T9SS type A sorting domain-containing protein [Ignavibacteria bacterium]|nr:T9SS type A sorting domain-containing protein [Ignavibacteria bacterium]